MEDLLNIVECVYQGPNVKLIQVRVPQPLFEELEKESKESGETVSDLIREFVAINLLPRTLERRLLEGKIDIAEMDSTVLDGAKRYLVEVETLLDTVPAVKKQVSLTKKHLAAIEEVVKQKVDKVMNETLDRLRKEHEENELKRRQRRAAGLTGRQMPLTHKVKESELTVVQKRQRLLAEVKDG